MLKILCILLILLSPIAIATSRGTFVFACVDIAPASTSCESGTNQNGPIGLIGIQNECITCMRHGVDGINFIGVVQSHLIWNGGERVFSCTFLNATDEITGSCTSSGHFPPIGEYFIQRCESLDINTGLPGGNGIFGCHMIHY